MLSAKDLLPLSWDELLKMDAFREAIWKGLGEKGPWEHDLRAGGIGSVGAAVGGYCRKCKKGGYELFGSDEPCPVPPPIKDPAEVVAVRLKGRAWKQKSSVKDFLDHIASIQDALRIKGSVWVWFGWEATPIQQIIVCLLVLGLIGV